LLNSKNNHGVSWLCWQKYNKKGETINGKKSRTEKRLKANEGVK
jgi:phage tail protein X